MNNRQTHRRGTSQQIQRHSKNKDLYKDVIDFKHNYAFSSQHSRSTALTVYKPKDKEKEKGLITKQKKSKKFSKNIEVEWRQDQAPYTPEEVVKLYSHLLEPAQRMQIRQYRNIYFIGKKHKENPHGFKKLMEQGFLQYKVGGHIAYRWQIIQKINRGSFGEVLKVYDHKTKELQALKIVKKLPEIIKQTFIQISILTNIKEKDKGDVSGIVRIKDFTIFREHICIAFQLMDSNLYELLHANEFNGLTESFVRVFTVQILNSLNFLQKLNIIHCDVKPENFVLRTWGKSGIKLIDFGTSCYQDQQIYTYIQSRYYRAPQIIFKKYYTTAIDMWSFGCLIAELSLGKPLFPGHTDLHQLLYIINLLGYPEAQFSYHCAVEIEKIRECRYLQKDHTGKIAKESIDRFQKDTGLTLDLDCLKPLQQRFENQMLPFVHFVKQTLKWDPKDRINAAEALQHPWVAHGLPDQIRELYTIYENLSKNDSKQLQMPKKKKRTKSKSKSKSKSKEKSQQKNSSISKIKIIPVKNASNLPKAQSKTLKFDLPHSLVTLKSRGNRSSQQKSKQEKSNKSPSSNKKSRN